FDVTNKAFAKPKAIDLSHFGWGIDSFPACFLDNDFMNGSYPAGSCSPVELTVRHSFRQVVDHDYEPMDWDGYRFQSYGAFTVERMGYARNYGMSDEKWHRFIARYPIWERSHYYVNAEAMTDPVACFTPETTPFGADPHRDEDLDGTEDECAAVGNGSRCDEFKQRCTLPFQERTPVTTPWYYTTGSHPEYFAATDRATHEWDVAMRVAARTAQYAECQRVGGTNCANRFPVYFGQQDENMDAIALAKEVDDCRHGVAYEDHDGNYATCTAMAEPLGQARGYSAGVIAIAQMPEMLVLCHSPVEANDPAACGDARLPEDITAEMCAEADAQAPADEAVLALRATCREARYVRPGDLRYHQVNVMEAPQTPSPWGIYTDAEDPLTGETVSASINVWSHVNDLWSQGVVDTMRYIAGELTTAEITDGDYVRNWAQAARAAAGGSQPGMTKAEVDRRMAAFAHRDHAHAPAPDGMKAPAPGASQLPESILEATRALRREFSGVKASVHAGSTTGATYAARRQAAEGSAMEAELMTHMVQELHGVDGLPLTDGLMDLTSPMRGGNPSVQRQLYHLRESALADRGACILHEAPAPISLVGLTEVMQAKFGAFNPEDSPDVQQARAEKMRRYIASRAHYSVIIHEMGHSIGMRHNFVSSSDAFNYRPQYWQLRTRNGAVASTCNDLVEDGTSCVGPRYFDPITEEERDNL
ncbi:MAG: hypothetical protein QF464_11130, partial [Myxococcota bacterium]|nr:hypothetical protein [Myxococcota bacterium]